MKAGTWLLAFFSGCVGMLTGGLIGAVLLSVFQYLYYVFFKPTILSDGQWGMIFLKTIPFGMVIGGVLGATFGIAMAVAVFRDEV